MSIFRARHIQFGLLLATVLGVSISPAAGQTYTPEQEQACTGDAFRLCSSDIPNIAAITVCMRKNRANLSVGCRSVMDKEAGKVAVK
jgi:hypothetical protein